MTLEIQSPACIHAGLLGLRFDAVQSSIQISNYMQNRGMRALPQGVDFVSRLYLIGNDHVGVKIAFSKSRDRFQRVAGFSRLAGPANALQFFFGQVIDVFVGGSPVDLFSMPSMAAIVMALTPGTDAGGIGERNSIRLV